MTSTTNETPLHATCFHEPQRRTDIIDLLVKHGARPSIKTQPLDNKTGPKTLGGQQEDVKPEELKKAATKSAFEVCQESGFDIKSYGLNNWSREELLTLVDNNPDFNYSRNEIFTATR